MDHGTEDDDDSDDVDVGVDDDYDDELGDSDFERDEDAKILIERLDGGSPIGRRSTGTTLSKKHQNTAADYARFPKTIDFERDLNMVREQIIDDLEMLGDIKYDVQEGLIEVNDFVRILHIVNKYIIRVHSLRLLVFERRKKLQKGD